MVRRPCSNARRSAVTASPLVALALLWLAGPAWADPPARQVLGHLLTAFHDHSGARLVFVSEDLPEGDYYERMPALETSRRVRAAQIALREVKRLPPGYLGRLGLMTVGVFSACISEQGDGFRSYSEELQGYRYFGIWNGSNALAAAYYSDRQLAQTLHHEIFHQVDATTRGKVSSALCFQRDDRFQDVIRGKDCYRAPILSVRDLARLRQCCRGILLEDAVSTYAEKSVGEDKAETARHLMTALPDSLVQVVTRPELPGSQRLLHVLAKYQQAVKDGPGIDWFVARALAEGLPSAVEARKPSSTSLSR